MGIALGIIYVSAFFAIFSTFVYLFALYENKERISSPKPKRIPSVTVIVPAFNEQGRIKRTVESLLNLNYPRHLLEIILVDDGSKDNTLNEMKEYESNKQIRISSKKNGGKASALNLGIKEAKGEIVVSLDADSFVDKNALMRMVGYFKNPNVMAVTPSMKVWNPKSIWQKVQFFEYMFGIFLRKAASFMGCIHVTPGPFSAYRKSFFQKYGGYKEGNLTEDIEVALRIQSNHFLIENSPDAYSYTLGPSKFNPLFRQRIRWYLGFLNNIWDYRHMFAREYGALGMFFLPSAFLSVFFTMFVVAYSIGKLLSSALNGLFNLWSINFDFTKLISLKIDSFYLAPSMITVITLLSLSFMGLIIYMARKISDDKDKIAGPAILSLLLYAPMFALWWFVTFAYKLGGRTVKWSGVVWKKD